MSFHVTSRLALILVLVLGLASIGLGQEIPGMKKTGKTIDNPQYQMWAKYKVGTSVTMKSTTAYGDFKSVNEMTTTLKSITKEKIVLSMATVTTAAGQETKQPAMDQSVEAKMEEWVSTAKAKENPDVKTEESTGKLKIAGKSLDCKVVKTTVKADGGDTVSTMWMNKEIPGEMVKMETKMQGGQTSMIVTAFTVK